LRGFTLVEVLVALFVVALGVAGAAAVQALAVHAAGEAARLSDGVQLAASLAQRMRVNPVAMALPDGANPYLQFELDARRCAACAGCPAMAAPIAIPRSWPLRPVRNRRGAGEPLSRRTHARVPRRPADGSGLRPGPAAAAPAHRSSSSWAGAPEGRARRTRRRCSWRWERDAMSARPCSRARPA
jgi:prepilin-type N-terminal cleavage/methylation domain-containing protein